MVTIDPPAPALLTLPTPSQIWRAVNTDRAVAITALICATVAFLGLVWGLTSAGDAGVIAAALATVLSAFALAWARTRGGGKEPPAV